VYCDIGHNLVSSVYDEEASSADADDREDPACVAASFVEPEMSIDDWMLEDALAESLAIASGPAPAFVPDSCLPRPKPPPAANVPQPTPGAPTEPPPLEAFQVRDAESEEEVTAESEPELPEGRFGHVVFKNKRLQALNTNVPPKSPPACRPKPPPIGYKHPPKAPPTTAKDDDKWTADEWKADEWTADDKWTADEWKADEWTADDWNACKGDDIDLGGRSGRREGRRMLAGSPNYVNTDVGSVTCSTARRNFDSTDVAAIYDKIHRDTSPPPAQNVDPARTAKNRARRTTKKRKGKKNPMPHHSGCVEAGGHVVNWTPAQADAVQVAADAEADEWDEDGDEQASGSGLVYG
jgi:hypothetical protein